MDNDEVAYRGLPTEIVEQIVEKLYEERQYAALKCCSLANRALLSLSQRHLFREIELHLPPSATSYAYSSFRLSTFPLLDAAPHIASYVHKLTIVCAGLGRFPMMDPWLPLLLPRLTHLRVLSMTAARAEKHDQAMHWDALYGVLGSSLLDKFASNSLTDIDLTGIMSVPVYIFRHCMALKRLSIASLNFDLDAPVPDKAPCQLDYLHLTPKEVAGLHHLAAWFSRPGCPLDVRRVQTLSYRPEHSIQMEAIDVLAPVLPCVTDLRISTELCIVGTQYNTLNYVLHPTQQPLPALRRFVNLRALTLDAVLTVRIFQHYTLVDYFTSPLPWIAAALRALAAAPSSSTLTPSPTAAALPYLAHVRLNLAFVGFSHDLLKLLHGNWVLLVQALQELPHFKQLELGIAGLSGAEAAALRADECLAGMVVQGRLVYT